MTEPTFSNLLSAFMLLACSVIAAFDAVLYFPPLIAVAVIAVCAGAFLVSWYWLTAQFWNSYRESKTKK